MSICNDSNVKYDYDFLRPPYIIKYHLYKYQCLIILLKCYRFENLFTHAFFVWSKLWIKSIRSVKNRKIFDYADPIFFPCRYKTQLFVTNSFSKYFPLTARIMNFFVCMHLTIQIFPTLVFMFKNVLTKFWILMNESQLFRYEKYRNKEVFYIFITNFYLFADINVGKK